MPRLYSCTVVLAAFSVQLALVATFNPVAHARAASDICVPVDVPFATQPTALGVDPFHSHTLMVAGERELYSTHTGNLSWTRIDTPWGDAVEWDIAYDPNRRDVVYVAVDNALFRSLDGGREFGLVAAFDRTNFTRITIAPSDSRVIYLWSLHTFAVGNTFATLPFIYKTADGGATWVTLAIDNAVDFAVSPNAADLLYVVDVDGTLFRSSDGGTSFVPLEPGFPTTQSTQHTIRVDPHDGDVVYASVGSGILRSIDAGSTWERRSETTGNLLAIDPGHAGSLYMRSEVADFNTALFRSDDAAATWVQVSSASTPSVLEFDTHRGKDFYLIAAALYRCDSR